MNARATVEGGAEAAAGAQSVRRALAVLRLVATGQEHGVRLADIAAMSGLARPTVHRLLKVLIDETAVEQDADTRRYRIGDEIALLGLARPSRLSLRSIAQPYLSALASEVGDTAFLSVRHGSDSVCIARYLGSHPIQVLSIDVGARRPLGGSVSGIVLLSGLPRAEAAALTEANQKRLQSLGREVAEVLAQVEAMRRRGYVYAERGVMAGTSAVAVPVRDGEQRAIAAVSVAALSERLRKDRLRSVVASMQVHAQRLGERVAEIRAARARQRSGRN